MKTGSIRRVFASIVCALVCVGSASAQVGPVFGPLQQLTNREVLLRLSASNGVNYRIDVSTNLPEWNGLATITATSTNLQHTDSGAPFVRERYYRAERLPAGTNVLTGDHLATTDGDAIFHPVNHAGFVISWNGRMIYNDPVCAATLYAGFPKADLILLSHNHGDHFNPTTINSVTNATTRIVAPQTTYNAMSTALRSITTVLAYGGSTTVLGVTVQAVRATNANHLEGVNNAYVTTIGGKRILTTGDCGPGPDLRAIQDIDTMFVCMNSFTMEVATAATLVREMRPKVVYPYHYGSQCGSPSYDVQLFKRLVGNDVGIEVRLRNWY